MAGLGWFVRGMMILVVCSCCSMTLQRATRGFVMSWERLVWKLG